MTTTDTRQATHVFRIYIRATPEKVWGAITDPEWNSRYGYAAPQFFELRPGGRFHSTASEAMKKASAEMGWPCPDLIVDGEVLESDPPRRLVRTWRMLMDPTTAAEPMTTSPGRSRRARAAAGSRSPTSSTTPRPPRAW